MSLHGLTIRPEPDLSLPNKLDSMNPFETEAYQQGVEAANQSFEEGHVKMDNYPNPYPYRSEEWQCWNMGWNYTVANQ